jgi:hypothetical protein
MALPDLVLVHGYWESTIDESVDSIVAGIEEVGLGHMVIVGHCMAGVTVPGIVANFVSAQVREMWRWPRLRPPIRANARKPIDTEPLWRIGRRVWTMAVVFFGRQHGFDPARIWRSLLPWRCWLRRVSRVGELTQYPSAAGRFISGQADLGAPNARLRQVASRTSLAIEKGSAGWLDQLYVHFLVRHTKTANERAHHG